MMQSSATFTVDSRDGTPLTVWVDGDGPPIVLVHGSMGDHTAWEIPLGELRPHFTTHALDRRGFGDSGDTPPYSIEREFEDVAVVVEAVAARANSSVVLWGHSYGAGCAMGGANLTGSVSHLILYEPSFGLAYPDGAIEAADAALAAGDRELAIDILLIQVLEMSSEEVAALRLTSRWPNLLKNVHTAPRECRVEQTWVYEPGMFSNSAETLFLMGSESPLPVQRASQAAVESVPGATMRTLVGHGHFAHRSDPEMVVDIIREYVGP